MGAHGKPALIRGASGQDGAYLARLVLEKEYMVFGTSRDAELSGFPHLRVLNLWRMLQRDVAEDFVIATGSGHSLKEFAAAVFELLGLNWRAHVVRDENLSRPTDLRRSCGEPVKANRTLGRLARHGMRNVVRTMVDAEGEGRNS